jgi:hypothetical protein
MLWPPLIAITLLLLFMVGYEPERIYVQVCGRKAN